MLYSFDKQNKIKMLNRSQKTSPNFANKNCLKHHRDIFERGLQNT